MSLIPDPISEAKTIFLGAVIALLFIAVLYLGYCKLSDEKTLAENQTLINDLSTQNASFKAAAEAWASKMGKIVAEEKKRADDAATAAETASRMAQPMFKEAATYQLLPPANPSDLCASTQTFLQNYFHGGNR